MLKTDHLTLHLNNVYTHIHIIIARHLHFTLKYLCWYFFLANKCSCGTARLAHARKVRTRTAHTARQAPTRGRKVRKKEERSGKPAVNSQLSYRRNEIEKKRIRKKEKPAVNARLSYRRNEVEGKKMKVEGKKMKNRYQITKKSTNQLSELISCTDPTKLPHIVCKKMHIILSFQ